MKRMLPHNLSFNTVTELLHCINHTFGSHTINELTHGITHVTLLHSNNNKIYNTVKTNEWSPKHVFDTLMLNLCRSSVDAIIVTGETIRNEPQLTMNLFGSHRHILQQYRHDVLCKYDRPDIVVMTRDQNSIDKHHPLLHTQHKVIYYTCHEPNSLLHCIQQYQSQYNSISIESGPNTTLPLYESIINDKNNSITIDTLLLSLYNGTLQSDQLVHTKNTTEFQLTEQIIHKLFPRSNCIDTDDKQWKFCIHSR